MPNELHIAVVDDEAIQIDTMKSLIHNAAKELNILVKVEEFSSGEAFLFELEDYPTLDIVFLDIEMIQVDGLDVAKKIRETDQDLTIVFATAFAEYAVQGYDVQALDYLLKPIKVEHMVRVFKRHLDRKPSSKESLTIESRGEVSKVYLEDILYVEVNKRECDIHVNDKVLTVNDTLKELADRLNADFVQTHRSYLVNIAHMSRLLNRDVELTNGESVPVSRRLAKEVQEKFVAHYRGTVFYND